MARVGAFFLAVAIAATAAAAAFAAQSPTALRKAIFDAARSRHSVHYEAVNVDRLAGSRTTFVCDVARDRGVQRITFAENGHTGHVTILVVRRTAYLRGDAFTLRSYLGFTKRHARRYAGRWISVAHGYSAYSAIAGSVTLGSFLHALYPQHVQKRISGTVSGQRVVGVRGTSSLGGTTLSLRLFAAAHGTPLPVEELTHAQGVSARTTISRWNEPVHVKAPAHAVPISRINGSGFGLGPSA